jgi:hypothetical protein
MHPLQYATRSRGSFVRIFRPQPPHLHLLCAVISGRAHAAHKTSTPTGLDVAIFFAHTAQTVTRFGGCFPDRGLRGFGFSPRARRLLRSRQSMRLCSRLQSAHRSAIAPLTRAVHGTPPAPAHTPYSPFETATGLARTFFAATGGHRQTVTVSHRLPFPSV